MIEIFWDDRFKRTYKDWINKHPDLVEIFQEKIEIFGKDPFHPSLRTHTLSGTLKGLWSCWISYDYRLIFKFMDRGKKKVLLIDVGTHDEVY
jgi:addiction module RelE/StbE family toxin